MKIIREWLRKKVDGSGLRKLAIVAIFLLMPLTTASIVTGFTLREAWKSRKLGKIWQPILIWALAYAWLGLFWLGLPTLLIAFLAN